MCQVRIGCGNALLQGNAELLCQRFQPLVRMAMNGIVQLEQRQTQKYAQRNISIQRHLISLFDSFVVISRRFQ
jgi:hypothetical protein